MHTKCHCAINPDTGQKIERNTYKCPESFPIQRTEMSEEYPTQVSSYYTETDFWEWILEE